jgi:hypothetical protein
MDGQVPRRNFKAALGAGHRSIRHASYVPEVHLAAA